MDRDDSDRLIVIETTVHEIKHRLLGNGQPGELDRIHERINGHGKRLGKLENWRWWVVGIAIGLGMASGAGIAHLVQAATR